MTIILLEGPRTKGSGSSVSGGRRSLIVLRDSSRLDQPSVNVGGVPEDRVTGDISLIPAKKRKKRIFVPLRKVRKIKTPRKTTKRRRTRKVLTCPVCGAEIRPVRKKRGSKKYA